MHKIKIQAKFIGRNGSCGYENGKTYELMFHTDLKSDAVWIARMDGDGACSYASIIKFFNNWTDIVTQIHD